MSDKAQRVGQEAQHEAKPSASQDLTRSALLLMQHILSML